MKIHSVSLEAWLGGHPPEHDDRLCREVYPWAVFERLDYTKRMRNRVQETGLGSERFFATVIDCEPGRENRLIFKIRLETPRDENPKWWHGVWSDLFHLIVEPDGRFVTLFTKRGDPSKKLVKNFMRGDIQSVATVRSLPVSRMLFRTLLDSAAADIFGELQPYVRYTIAPGRCRFALPDAPPYVFEPFRSRSDLWVLHSFTEEKAHRLALGIAGACKRIVVVYCHPTFTRHHRCADASVDVVSGSRFLSMGSAVVRSRYLRQTQFLVNHLRSPAVTQSNESEGELRTRILSGKEASSEVTTSELREVKAGLGRIISTTGDAAYVLACANLLNAALNKKLHLYKGRERLDKDVYAFKAELGASIQQLVRSPLTDVHVYVAPDDLVLVRVHGIQFSFHAVPQTGYLRSYVKSHASVPQEWSGIRLQPIAPLVLRWARALLMLEPDLRARTAH
jgi:hypothetical protein